MINFFHKHIAEKESESVWKQDRERKQSIHKKAKRKRTFFM